MPFCMSDVLTSRSFSASKVRAILTDALDTALAYVRLFGASTLATRLTLQEMSSILIENTM